MFKSYAIIETSFGVRVFPASAFMHPDYLRRHGWQCLIENPSDETTFKVWRPSCAWVIKCANKRGFGVSEPPS